MSIAILFIGMFLIVNIIGWMESYLLKETESIPTTAFLPFEPDLLKVAEISNASERCL